jgi:DNA ligase-1
MISKPMLAETCDDTVALKFPVLATPKLDGIRCLIMPGVGSRNHAVSRKFKSIPNHHISDMLSTLPVGLDGELMLRPTVDSGQQATFQQVTSSVMSEDGEPDFVYNVFDYAPEDLRMPYHVRMKHLASLALPTFVEKVLPKLINNVTELTWYEAGCLADGYEGVMVRDPNGPYKCGRSTVREGYLLKIKRFKDAEARVVGFTAKMHNTNEATIDELGHTKRSSAKAGLVALATLGALVVQDMKTGVFFEIGTGFDDATRKQIWQNPTKYKNRLVKYKSQEIGTKDKPRFPVFLGFRDARDL